MSTIYSIFSTFHNLKSHKLSSITINPPIILIKKVLFKINYKQRKKDQLMILTISNIFKTRIQPISKQSPGLTVSISRLMLRIKRMLFIKALKMTLWNLTSTLKLLYLITSKTCFWPMNYPKNRPNSFISLAIDLHPSSLLSPFALSPTRRLPSTLPASHSLNPP